MSQALKSKKSALFLYINSGKLKTTLTLTLNQTRLDYTILPLPRHLTYLWLCSSFAFSSLLQLSLLLWLSFHEALQSCFTDILALHSIVYYTILCSNFLPRLAFNPLLRNLRYLWLCPRFGFSSMLQLSLWLWLFSYEGPQSCFDPN